MNIRACFSNVTLTTLMLLAPCLAGEFGQTQQHFAQYGIGGPAETAFDVHNPGEAAIDVEVELFKSDGSPDLSDMLAVPAGGTASLVFNDPKGEVRNSWARLTSADPFNATVFFRIAGVGNVGVLPGEPGVKFKLFSLVEGGTNTAYAVANTSETESSTVMMRSFNTNGELQKEVEKTYGPGEHEAVFVTQEPLLVEENGLVEFIATENVILEVLRTDGNLLASMAKLTPEGGAGADVDIFTSPSATSIGVDALKNNTGPGSTASGVRALFTNTTGADNTATGADAMKNNSTGQANTASGTRSLFFNSTGTGNTALGLSALRTNISGANNTAVGRGADVTLDNLSNATAIGANAKVDASNKIRLGDANVSVIEAQVALTVISDKTKKENFQPVDGEEVLSKLRSLEIPSWNLIGQDPEKFRHYGPMAQDFFAAFGKDGVGTVGTPTTINTGDLAGILMIAVQRLEERNVELKTRAEEFNAELKARVEELERAIKKMH